MLKSEESLSLLFLLILATIYFWITIILYLRIKNIFTSKKYRIGKTFYFTNLIATLSRGISMIILSAGLFMEKQD